MHAFNNKKHISNDIIYLHYEFTATVLEMPKRLINLLFMDIPEEKNGGDRFVLRGCVRYGHTPRLPRLQYDALHAATSLNLPRLNIQTAAEFIFSRDFIISLLFM